MSTRVSWFLYLFMAGGSLFFPRFLNYIFRTKAKEHKKFFLSRGFLVWSQGSEYKKREGKNSCRSIRVLLLFFLFLFYIFILLMFPITFYLITLISTSIIHKPLITSSSFLV